MDDDTAKPDPSRSEFAWPAGAEDDCGVFFFGSAERDSNSILGEFGWSAFHAADDYADRSELSAAAAAPMEEGAEVPAAEAAADRVGSASNNPSASSSSSEEQPEKSTGSGGGVAPAETA